MYDLGLLVACCALLGCIVGFLAGLLGIGGGLIIVPALSTLLILFNVTSAEHVVVISIATSLASIYLLLRLQHWLIIKMIMCLGMLHLGLWLV